MWYSRTSLRDVRGVLYADIAWYARAPGGMLWYCGRGEFCGHVTYVVLCSTNIWRPFARRSAIRFIEFRIVTENCQNANVRKNRWSLTLNMRGLNLSAEKPVMTDLLFWHRLKRVWRNLVLKAWTDVFIVHMEMCFFCSVYVRRDVNITKTPQDK